jgi:exonuclease SbcC
MIQFDYSLEVDMGTEKRTYLPPVEIPKDLKNIFRLQGPNSSGKSTLMNIIAIASHGLTKGKMPPSVRSRMEELVVPGYKDLQFDILIQDPVTKRAIKSSKKKGEREVIVRESTDGGNTFSIIAADQFEKKYNLIYDIPENPVGRLNELIGEIKTVQSLFTGKTQLFQRHVEGISNDISNSASPNAIKRMEEELKFDESQLTKYNLNAEETYVRKLNELMVALKLKDLNDKADYADSVLKSHKKEIGNSESGKAEKDYTKKMKDLADYLYKLKVANINLVTEANKIKYSKYEELKSAMSTISEDSDSMIKSGGVTKSAIDSIFDLKKFADELRSDSKGEELKVMSEIIRLLDQYVDKNISLPQIGQLDVFLKDYKKKYEEMNSISSVKSLNYISENSEKALDQIKKINDLIPKINIPVKDKTESFERSNEILKMENQRKEARELCSSYIREVSNDLGINLQNLVEKLSELNSFFENEYEGKSFNDIKDLYNVKKKELDQLRSDKREIEDRVARLRSNINTEKAKPVSPYKDYKKEIEDLKNEVSNLMKSMKSAGEKLEAVEKKKYGIFEESDPFFKSVWTYLGKRLKNIKHLDKEYIASSVNLIEEIITTSDGTIIHLSDMGTGQSQLSYLKGLLSADDDRMLIALFDEVSTMTDSTLDNLFEEFKKLQNDGRLMVGMTVSPSDTIEVSSYGI